MSDAAPDLVLNLTSASKTKSETETSVRANISPDPFDFMV